MAVRSYKCVLSGKERGMTVPDSPVRIRPIRPSDYRTVIAVIDDW